MSAKFGDFGEKRKSKKRSTNQPLYRFHIKGHYHRLPEYTSRP